MNNMVTVILDFLNGISIWGWIIIIPILLFIFIMILGSIDSKKAGKKAGKYIKHIDAKYQDYIENKISNEIINNNSFDLDKNMLLKEVLIILKPDIESLIAHINNTIYEAVPIDYSSTYFNNVISLSQSLFKQSRKEKSQTLKSEDKKRLYDAFNDAILADLTQREERL